MPAAFAPGVPACPATTKARIRIRADGGRYWVRTSDLFRVREARYRCANRPYALIERWRRDSNPCIRLCRPLPRLSATPPWETHRVVGCLRADDGTRTRDPHLGKVMLYQLSHIRIVRPGDCPTDVPEL